MSNIISKILLEPAFTENVIRKFIILKRCRKEKKNTKKFVERRK